LVDPEADVIPGRIPNLVHIALQLVRVGEVVAIGEVATIASEGQIPEKDVAHRDARGHFTVTYNRRRTRRGIAGRDPGTAGDLTLADPCRLNYFESNRVPYVDRFECCSSPMT